MSINWPRAKFAEYNSIVDFAACRNVKAKANFLADLMLKHPARDLMLQFAEQFLDALKSNV